MHMRHVMWLLLAALLSLGLLTIGVSAQEEAAPDQAAVSQSQTTVEQSSSSTTETTVSGAYPPAVAPAPGTVVAPGAVMVAPGMVAYNPAAEVTLSGMVVSGPMLAAPTDMDLQMTIRTSDGVLHRVWLAPQRFVQRLRFAPGINDQVTVIGMPVGATGDIVARQITWSGNIYALRNTAGAPLWMGRRERRRAMAPSYYATGAIGDYSTLWNSNQVRTISGRIDRIENFYPGGEAMGPGVAIRVRLSGLEPEDVPAWQLPSAGLEPPLMWAQLGPAWYVRQQFPDLRSGQQVTITGSPALYHGQNVLLASTLHVGTRTVAFRNSTGYPMWAGGWQNWSQGTAVSVLPGYYGAYPMYGAVGYQTISGTIESVQNVPAVGGIGPATLVSIRTADGNLVNVAIAPSSFAQQFGLQLAPGQPITVVAAPVAISQPVFVASQVFYANQSFAMSSVSGVPAWSVVSLPPPTVVGALPAAGVVPTSYQVSGTIQNVQNVPAMGTVGPMTVLTVLTANNCTYNVAVQPASFADQFNLQFQPGQQITVVAAPAMVNGQQLLIASQMNYNGQSFVMNTATGVWSMATGVAVAPIP